MNLYCPCFKATLLGESDFGSFLNKELFCASQTPCVGTYKLSKLLEEAKLRNLKGSISLEIASTGISIYLLQGQIRCDIKIARS